MGLDWIVVAAISSLLASGASIYSGIQSSKQAAKAQKISRRRERLEQQQERRRLIRQQRQATAEIIASQEDSVDSSAVAGGVAASKTQLSGELGFLNQQEQLANQQANLLASASRRKGTSLAFQGVSKLASTGVDWMMPGADGGASKAERVFPSWFNKDNA